MSEENKALVRPWFAELDKGNRQIVDDLIAVDYIDHSNSRSWFVNLLYDHRSGQWEGHAILSAVFGSNFCNFTSQVVWGKASPSRHGGVACPLWERIWGVGSQS